MPCFFSFPNRHLPAQQSLPPSVLAPEKERREGGRRNRGPRACRRCWCTCSSPTGPMTPWDGEEEERSGSPGFVIVLAAIVDVNPNLLLWIKFCGSNHLTRRGLGVIPEIIKINPVHILKFRQTVQFLFIIVVFGDLRGFNKFYARGQCCRGLQQLSLDTKNFL